MPDHALDLIIALVAAFVLAVTGGLAWAGKRWLKDEIAKATYAIQPHANGGLSLPDVAKSGQRTEAAVEKIAERQQEIHAMVASVTGALDAHMKNHA